MGELTGNLIEMNAKMVVTDTATVMIWVGILAAVGFLILFVYAAINNASYLAAVFFIMMAIGVIVGVRGAKMQRVKEIRYCANGPIAIETVAAKYDIVSINGKEITVRER